MKPARVLRGARVGRSLKPLRRPWLWAAVWIGLIALVVILSLIAPPTMELPSGSDKLEHLFAYFVLAAFAVQLFARWPALFGAGLGMVLLGIGLECVQGAMAMGRMLDRADALANTLGVIAGLATQLSPWRDALLHWDTH